MALLVHLNGPPGIGKSTLSAIYAARHPGTLNLDIDLLHRLIGGWQDEKVDVHGLLRPVALAMAAAHLHGGRDVIVPQYLARLDEITAFENVALEENAEFHEVVLIGSREESIERFARRAQHNDDPWVQHSSRIVAGRGGPVQLGSMYDDLLEVVRLRPAAVVVRNPLGAVEESYSLLRQALWRASKAVP